MVAGLDYLTSSCLTGLPFCSSALFYWGFNSSSLILIFLGSGSYSFSDSSSTTLLFEGKFFGGDLVGSRGTAVPLPPRVDEECFLMTSSDSDYISSSSSSLL